MSFTNHGTAKSAIHYVSLMVIPFVTQRKVLDGSLGFAAGVMTAASFWSLLAPAIELAETSGSYGAEGEWAFLPVALGFLLGALFVYAADELMSTYGIQSSSIMMGECWVYLLNNHMILYHDHFTLIFFLFAVVFLYNETFHMLFILNIFYHYYYYFYIHQISCIS